MEERTTYVGLDVHKKIIHVALLRPGTQDPATWDEPNGELYPVWGLEPLGNTGRFRCLVNACRHHLSSVPWTSREATGQRERPVLVSYPPKQEAPFPRIPAGCMLDSVHPRKGRMANGPRDRHERRG